MDWCAHSPGQDHLGNQEAYVLGMDENAVVVAGVGNAGAFYGLQTIKQLWNASWGNCTSYCAVPQISVVDWQVQLN